MRVVIGTSVSNRWRQQWWGDTHFAEAVSAALSRRGIDTEVRRFAQLRRLEAEPGLVVLYLRGLEPTPVLDVPIVTWLISHPSTFDAVERERCALFLSASPTLAQRFDGAFVAQATDADRFRPGPGPTHDLLFVGNSRGVLRSSVEHATALAPKSLAVYGRGWKQLLPELNVRAKGVPNDELAGFYANAKVVLNDHWPDMAAAGIVSNRIYDALACGASLLTDRVEGMATALSDLVTTYGDRSGFEAGVAAIRAMPADERAERGERARQLIECEHTFDTRAEVLIDALRGAAELS